MTDIEKLEEALKYADTWGYGTDDGYERTVIDAIMGAARAHLAAQRRSPAVTGDRATLDAHDVPKSLLCLDRAYNILTKHYPEYPKDDDKDMYEEEAWHLIHDHYHTIRAALLSAQGGVPHDVVAKVYYVLERATHFKTNDGQNADEREALELLKPYRKGNQ